MINNFKKPIPLPINAPASITVSELSDTQLRLTVERGSGLNLLITAKAASQARRDPVGNTTYSANSVFGSGTNLGANNYAVYKGTGNTVLVTGLTPSTSYDFFAWEFNGGNGSEKFNFTVVTVRTTTLTEQVAPSTQATALVFEGDRNGRCTAGNGQGRLWLYNTSGTINASFLPQNGVTYTKGQVIGGGNIVGDLGAKTNFTVENLPYSTNVAHRVFEYNIASGSPLYNTNTATGNPLVQQTIALQNWYAYKDTAFLTRRSPFNLSSLGSREFSQIYPTADWIGTTHHHVFLVNEGDGNRLVGIDRTIRYKRALADDPTLPSSWVKDGPVDAWGDTPSFLDSACLQYPQWVAGTYNSGDRVRTGTSNMQVWESTVNGNTSNPTPGQGGTNWTEIPQWDGNQCWMMSVVEHGGYQYGVYVANRFIANRYGIGIIVSNDEFATYTRLTSPIIAESATLAAYYCHVHPTKTGGFWYMFVQNYVPSYLVENHLYSCEIWRTANDPTPSGWTGWTKISGTVDQLSGRGYGGAVDISQSWEEGGRFYAYISPNEANQDGGYHANQEGSPTIRTTFPVGNKILLISWTDWTNFKDGHIVEREIYRSPQDAEIDVRTWCPKRTFGGNDFFVAMRFLWKCQTLLGSISQNEPMNDGLIVSRSLNLTNNVQVGNDIYPNNVKFALPHKSALDDTLGGTPVRPRNVILGTNGTVVGAPKIARLNSIQPVDGGFVTFPNADFTYSATHLAVKVVIGQNNLTDVYGICGMDTDQPGGQHGWHIRKAGQNIIEVWVYGADNTSYKRYRATLSTNKANNDAALMHIVGFEFKNGVLKVRIDYNLDCEVTKLQDDSFTQLNVSDEPLRLGAIYPVTTDELYSRDIVGGFLMWEGSANVSDANWLNTNLIGY